MVLNELSFCNVEPINTVSLEELPLFLVKLNALKKLIQDYNTEMTWEIRNHSELCLELLQGSQYKFLSPQNTDRQIDHSLCEGIHTKRCFLFM